MPQSKRLSLEEEEEEEEEVMSEVHVGCPPNFSGPYISHFTFPSPLSSPGIQDWGHSDQLQEGEPSTVMLRLDDDGDLALARRGVKSLVQSRAQCIEDLHPHVKDTSSENLTFDEDGDLVLTRQSSNYERYPICAVAIQHSITSSLPSVGLQVWMAALVLTDFVLHKISTSSDFNGTTALELGAGTGLVGLVLALVARTIFITDRGSDVLENCTTNIRLNSSVLKYPETSVCVRELDWREQWPPRVQTRDSESQRLQYSWTPSEIEEAEGASFLFAADVIYNDELTDSFFSILEKLMSRGSEKVLYLALEKRYNFSMDDLDVVANGYAHFQSFLKDEEECIRLDDNLLPCFKGERLDISHIPQYIREYERGKDVELWKITYFSNKPRE
ncbi:uncharacterized protein A4U43_C05F32850 [Asparagus officinalis]|uniref:Methyltransferase-like protein 22 n=1 Tax=Asparagus officinalis TaxID=4686 RepID=A0A5P1EY18_ASPOF|nr:methyltransferase-like protein 22 isoform X2 [Asparagus officinalis]ONK70353.1 uncharacterized protein A4U43_C05F32850 [Asparagus officinalis]